MNGNIFIFLLLLLLILIVLAVGIMMIVRHNSYTNSTGVLVGGIILVVLASIFLLVLLIFSFRPKKEVKVVKVQQNKTPITPKLVVLEEGNTLTPEVLIPI